MKQKGLGTLTAYLPYGYGKAFSQRFGCSVSKIYKVVVGNLVDYRILDALREEAEKNFILTQQISNRNKKIKK